MEIRHLKLVMTVAEEGSLTKASEKLHLTQSALSHQLKEVETEFETALFHRINKRMVLTTAGKIILQSAQRIMAELEKSEGAVRQLVSGEAGRLRLSTECYTCYHWLPPLLKSYHQGFPQVDVRVVAEATRQPLQALFAGTLDVAIGTSIVEDNNLIYTELFADELVAVTHIDHPLSQLDYFSIPDFDQQHLITYTIAEQDNSIFQRLSGISPKKVSQIQLTEAIVELVKADMGITIMARWAITPYLETGQLAIIPITEAGLFRMWYAITLDLEKQPGYIAAFVEHLARHLPA